MFRGTFFVKILFIASIFAPLYFLKFLDEFNPDGILLGLSFASAVFAKTDSSANSAHLDALSTENTKQQSFN